MIDKKTVFVLGAGASKPYGFPTGLELKIQITENFTGILDKVRQSGDPFSANLQPPAQVKQFVDRFREADTNSIDLFLSRHRTVESIVSLGKLAISVIILEREWNSQFNLGLHDKFDQDWLNYLLTRMTSTMRTEEVLNFSSNDVSFISFNYDRSLENYLHQSLTHSFPSEYTETLENELKELRIVHIHGSLALLPWQDSDGGRVLPYPKERAKAQVLVESAKNIRVVGESEDHADIAEARGLLGTAEEIYFLGFGFAEENILTLDIPSSINPSARIYGTVKGFVGTEISSIKNQFAGLSQRHGKFDLLDVDSKRLLKEFL